MTIQELQAVSEAIANQVEGRMVRAFADLRPGTYRAVQVAESDYLRVGELYEVECVGRTSAYFRSVGRGSGTTISRVSFVRCYRPLVLVAVTR